MACHNVRNLSEGVTCLQIFRQQKLAMTFQENIYLFLKLIGCVELADSSQIWPKHLLTIKRQKRVRGSLYIFGYFFCGHRECKRVGKLFDTVTIWVYKG